MAMTVDGLVTGMSTSDTVTQLMQVEALPQTALKNKVTAQSRTVTAYQNVSTKMLALVAAAKALNDPNAWASMKATSSSDAAVVSALPGAAAGSFSFKVEALAATHTATFTAASVASPNDAVMDGDTFDIRLTDGSMKTLTPTDRSLKSVAAAINGDADSMFKATTVQLGPGKYTLQLTAKTSGEDAAFSNDIDGDGANDLAGALTGLNLSDPTLTSQGANGRLKVGTTVDAYEVISATNTFAEVQPGVTVTATKKQADADAPVTISLASDVDGITAKLQALVDTANTALSEIATQTKNKNGTVAAGPLVGDSAMRKLSQDIMSTVSGGAGALGTFKSIGIKLIDGGKLDFDTKVFTEKFTADPAGTQAYLNSFVPNPVDHPKASATAFDPGWDQPQGLAGKLLTVGMLASEGVKLPTDLPGRVVEGTLTGLIQRRNATIKSLNDQVSAWDVRLDLRKAALQKQFSNLEVAMGKMQQQSSWLASQLAGLG